MGGTRLKLLHTLSRRAQGQICLYISNVSTRMLVPTKGKKSPSSLKASRVSNQKILSITKEVYDSSSSATINADIKYDIYALRLWPNEFL
jgi:hypothetical protein